jgi:hypothetical protein
VNKDSQQLGRVYEDKKAAHDDLLGRYFIVRSHSGLTFRKRGLAPDAAAWKAIDDAHAEMEKAWEAWRGSM